ncbi:MAG: hypothetical protein HY420_00755 [Candidatus Kerfeldbacteria bacterium]|nr:hypothetical protein [Candidatus Kerfeldbacteria bacterium]
MIETSDLAFTFFHENSDLEKDVLPAVARHGHLRMYPHEGYWNTINTQKDLLELRQEWEKEGLI